MANIWWSCLAILTCFSLATLDAKSVGYNVVSPEHFQEQIASNSEFLRVVYFATGETQGYIATSFKTNFKDAGEHLKNSNIFFMTIDCKNAPVKDYCGKPRVDSIVFVFRDGFVMDELPLDTMFSVDSIVANVLHLALLTEVPTVANTMELSAVIQRAKGIKDVVFGKLKAIGTQADREFMEVALANNKIYQFVITTVNKENLLGTSDDDLEWEKSDSSVWYFDCINTPKKDDCKRVTYQGPMTIPNFKRFLKTWALPLVYERTNAGEKIFTKPLHDTLGVPVAYVVTTKEQYDEHKQILHQAANMYRGNIAFAINVTEPDVIMAEVCPRLPPCMIIKPPKGHPMELHKPFNLMNAVQLLRNWMLDYFFVPEIEEEEAAFYDHDVPDQEVQDDSVALAVDNMNPLMTLNLTVTPALTDKTFQEFLDDNKLAIITFTIRWDPRSLAFLKPYLNAAKTLIKELSLDHSPLAHVECSNWPDVCEQNNVTAYPSIKIYRHSTFMMDYRGLLNTSGILRAYYLHTTPNPLVLSDVDEVEAFKKGELPKWSGNLLQAVIVAVIPEVMKDDNVVYTELGRLLHGDYLLGLCTGRCAVDMKVSTTSNLFVAKWHDEYQPVVKYIEEFQVGKIKQFIEDASQPLLPEVTAASLPKLFWKKLPFVVLFHVPGEDSDRIKQALARLVSTEDRVVMSWMDASPDSMGSQLLHTYKFREISPPKLVFLDHSTSRVCNYPEIELIKSEKALLVSVISWITDLLNHEGNCNALRSGHYEPQVPSYDFLAIIKAERVDKDHNDGGMSGEEMANSGDEETAYEDEIFGDLEDGSEEDSVDMKHYGHIEL